MRVIVVVLSIALLSIFSINTVSAHSGRTDSSGGHNCNVGACAGTYHYHNGGSGYTPPAPKPAPTPAPVVAPVLSITTEIVTEEESIIYKTKTEDNAEILKGETVVEQEGENGVKTITYEVTYTDGVETNREKTGEEVTTKPVEEIIHNGTKEKEVVMPVEEVSDNNTEDEEELTLVDTVISLGIMGGLGYGGYRGVKKLRSKKV